MRPLFVMIKCDLGTCYEVAEAIIDQIPETSEVHSISGQYDLLAKFFIEEGVDIGRFVTEKVQRIGRIKDTFTLIAYRAFTA